MKWKDWLFIPKGDKAAIVALLLVILILLGIYFFLSTSKKRNANFDISSLESVEYKEWQSQLKEKIANEGIQDKQKEKYYNKTYQHKLKAGETIELNSADTSMLKTIPGIGSGYANRIVKYRTALRGFVKIEQLNEVWGMDTYLYSQVSPFATLIPQRDSLYINTESFEELLSHPYLNYKQVQVIVDIRERKGAIRSLARLQLLEEFKKRDIENIALYISFKQ